MITRKLLAFLSVASGLLYQGSASAVQLTAVGQVAFVRAHDSGIIHADADWIAIQGLTSLGNCLTSDGFVVLRIRDDAKGSRMFSVAMMARATGTSVTVSVDDASTDPHGYCWMRTIS